MTETNDSSNLWGNVDQDVVAPSLNMTAYLTACSRANDVNLSLDSFASLWVPAEAWKYHKQYLQTVSPWEGKLIALRGRYFLERIRTFFKGTQDGALINVAAGFTSYAYLLEGAATVQSIEFDSPALVREKNQKSDHFIQNGMLPQRDVRRVGLDLNSEALKHIVSLPENNVPADKVFFLLEGITYYLDPSTIKALFQWIESYPAHHKQVALVYWPRVMENNHFVQKYSRFLAEREGVSHYSFTFIEPEELLQMAPSLRTLEAKNYLDLAGEFGLNPRFQSLDDIFGEEFLLLGN